MCCGLLGVADGAGLTDDGDLHLSWVGHLVLDTLGDLSRERGYAVIICVLCPDDDTQFATSLDGVGLDYPWVG